MKNQKIIYLIWGLISLFSCDKELTVDSSPRGDFDLFFEYLEQDYAYRDEYAFTMRELKQSYLAQIEASNTKSTLAAILLNIQENDLKDPHLYFHNYEIYNLAPQIGINERPDLETKTPFFDEINIRYDTPYYTSGTVSSNPSIGYLYIRNFNFSIGGSSSFDIDDGVKEIDDIIEDLIDMGIGSMIVDIRSSAGGSNYIPRYVAQRFIDKKATYMVEYYPEGDSFVKKEWTLKPKGTGFRSAKISLLSNGVTASGGEMLVLALLKRDHLIHIGSNSLGASGNIVDKDLSNGWNFTMTNSRTEHPDGTQYFKVGITPSIIVKNNADFGVTHFNDKLIAMAIEELQ